MDQPYKIETTFWFVVIQASIFILFGDDGYQYKSIFGEDSYVYIFIYSLNVEKTVIFIYLLRLS